MIMSRLRHVLVATAFALAVTAPSAVLGQVGKGLADLNSMPQAALAALPGMTPAAAAAFVAKRPFASIVDANAFLLSQKLTQDQLNTIYTKAFVHVNLNTGTAAEILLIPGAGKRMAHEFEEYRPWRNWAHFDKEIGKYVPQTEVDRLKQYVFIPININTAADDVFLTIPGVGQRMVGEFKEYRPWTSEAQFRKEIGKYVDQNEVARLWRYFVLK
jgi:DNA uptake protein ComE-like DNA-binding protein